VATRIPDGLKLRRLLLLGYAGIFAVWLGSAWALTEGMTAADVRGAEIRTQFLHNDQLLSTVRAQVLLSSVLLRDALLETATTDTYVEQLRGIRRSVSDALREYVPQVKSDTEREQWLRLQAELRNYWDTSLPVLTLDQTPTAMQARSVLLQEVIPKRETIIRISDRIHNMNQAAFEKAQGEVSELRRGLRRRVWDTSGTAVALGLLVAFVATRHAGVLESRLREQRVQEERHKTELERLSSKLMQAQEEERRRIARELHDEVGQALSAIKLELAVAERQPLSERSKAPLAEARAITERALQSVRDMSQLLHPSMLDDLGLPDTANWYLGGFSRRTGIQTELVVDELTERIAPELEVCTYRVIQEAVTNVARHADASKCRVEIRAAPDGLRIVVEDNGRGFDPRVKPGAAGRGLGLVSVRERVATLGGALQVESRVGQGTRLTVELPLKEKKWAS
jgi:signal transduction histidine kinase